MTAHGAALDTRLRELDAKPAELARLVHLAYDENLGRVVTGLQADGWTLVEADLHQRDLLLAMRRYTLVAALPGLEFEWRDLFEVANIWPTAPVWPGVAERAVQLVHHLRGRIADWQGHVIVAGHSFGGAVALVASLMLPITAVAFGAPCALDRRHRHRLDPVRAWHVAHWRDPIPRLPPWPFGWRAWPRTVRLGALGPCTLRYHQMASYVDAVTAEYGR